VLIEKVFHLNYRFLLHIVRFIFYHAILICWMYS